MAVKHYDNIVVGSGASGLTLAQLLALNGRKVLLLEKSWILGGALARFRKKGLPFDIGFHFTGGLTNDGILHEMLTVLGVRESIEPIILKEGKANRYVFEKDHKTYEIPSGVEEFKQALFDYFPDEKVGIEKYFARAKKAYEGTASIDLQKITQIPAFVEDDYVSLSDVLNELMTHPHLKGILATYCMCYGVKPSETSFTNHARVAYGLYEAVVRVKEGGDAFIKAFKGRLEALGVEIKMRTYITECADIEDRTVKRFVLNTGDEVSCDQCIFTIHPKEILKTLPRQHLSKAFIDRVESFEPSLGFFSFFGVLRDQDKTPLVPTITSLLPDADVNEVLNRESHSATALVVLTSNEIVKGEPYKLLTALESSFVEDVEEWKDTTLKKRPDSYEEYKQKRIDSIVERITNYYPEYKDQLEVIDAASILSFRDFLNSYDGSAYGVKQKMGQLNLFGRLPLRNLYAAGQSSVLPGIIGAMLSSFIVLRSIIRREAYDAFINERLPR